MKTIRTEEMRCRQVLCEYAIKNGVTKAARRYHTNRQFVYRQLEKYNGNVWRLALKSRKPATHPNTHTGIELKSIKDMLLRNGKYGLAEVYVRCQSKGYARTFGSMCMQVREKGMKVVKKRRKSFTKYNALKVTFPGEKVQIDIKYVPQECIKFPCYDKRYY